MMQLENQKLVQNEVTYCKNLLELIEAVKKKVWGEDWEKATGKKIEINPHIEMPMEAEAEKENLREKGICVAVGISL